jgi:hypothetical protein
MPDLKGVSLRVKLIQINLADPRQLSVPPANHPELDVPDGELSWERWLEGRQRLETALLFLPVS